MNFLFFISEKSEKFHTLLEAIPNQQIFKSFYAENVDQEKILVVKGLTQKHKDFYLEYSGTAARFSPDLKYWLKEADFQKVENDFSFPILHELSYHGTETIELYLDALVQEIHNSALKENVYFGDELSDYFLCLEEFTKKWDNNKLFFFWEN